MAPSLILHRRSQVPADESAAFGPVAERFRRAGDLERAVSLCRDGLKRFPHHMSARVTLGWALLDLGKYDEAQAELETVLRRAPDNLAAIRGLAELHDRAEHTMNLPMDGPGQWPPDEAAVNQAATEQAQAHDVHAPAVEPVAISAPVEYGVVDIAEPESDTDEGGPAVFAAADYQSSVWAPVSEPEPVQTSSAVTEQAAAEQAVAEQAAAEPVAQVAEESVSAEPVMEAPMAGVAEQAEAIAEPPAAEWTEPSAVAAAEEPLTVAAVAEAEKVEAVAAVAEAEPIGEAAFEATFESSVLEPEVAPYVEVEEKPVVSEADIAALIAEAERLEAAAESAAAAADPLELDADVELASLEAFGLELEPADPVAREETAPVAAAEAQPVAVAEAQPVVVAEAPMIAAAEEIAPVAAVETELPMAVADVTPIVAADVEPVAADVEPAVAAAVAPMVAAEVEPIIAAIEPVVREHVAEVISLARVVRPDPAAAQVAALERFLMKVQARRAQVMTQSVA